LSTVGYFSLLRLLFGHDPVGYHAVQLALQVANAVLVFLLADRIFPHRAYSVATALAYTTAPGHAIAACWNALCTMSGAALFYLLGLWLWLGLRGWQQYGVGVFFFGLTLLSSEHGITFPVALTAATILLHPREQWRAAAIPLVCMYAVAIAYLAGKIYHTYVLLPESVTDPIVLGVMQSAYRPSFDVWAALENVGRYVGFTVNGLYEVTFDHPRLNLFLGLAWLIAWVLSVVVAYSSREGSDLRKVAFGLTLFGAALAPVVFLPHHVYSYYVGIAGAGLAIAIVASIRCLLPRPYLVSGVVVALATLLFSSSMHRVTSSEEFRFFWGFSESAARWLHTLALVVSDAGVSEVVVPRSGLAETVFDDGQAHRVLLCANYAVRQSADIVAERPGPGRLIVREPLMLTGDSHRSWRWLVEACR